MNEIFQNHQHHVQGTNKRIMTEQSQLKLTLKLD